MKKNIIIKNYKKKIKFYKKILKKQIKKLKIFKKLKVIVKKVLHAYKNKYKPKIKLLYIRAWIAIKNINYKYTNIYNSKYKDKLYTYTFVNIRNIIEKIIDIFNIKCKNTITNAYMYVNISLQDNIKNIKKHISKDKANELYRYIITNIIFSSEKIRDIYNTKYKEKINTYSEKILNMLNKFISIYINQLKNLIIQINNFISFVQLDEFKILIKYFNLLLDLIILIFLYILNYSILIQMLLHFSLKTKLTSKLFSIPLISNILYFTKIVKNIPIISALLKRKNVWIYSIFSRITLYVFKYLPFFGKTFSTRLKFNYYYLLTLNMLFSLGISWLEFIYPNLAQYFYDIFIILGTMIYFYSFIQACYLSYPIFPGLSEASRRFCRRSTHKND